MWMFSAKGPPNRTPRSRLRGAFFRWLDRRVPAARGYVLRRDKLYILPTRTGLVFGALIVVLWMLGTNYQNNLILAMSLLLLSLFVLTILRTHSNLSGLELTFHDADAGFAGQEVAFHLDVVNHSRRPKDNVRVAWQGQVAAVFALDARERKRIAVCAFAAKRGYLMPGRLLVETVFPLGLLRCWSWLNMEARATVYPKPHNLRELQSHAVEDARASPLHATGTDEFAGLRAYRPGDSLKQVAWKQYAREKGLMSKEFSSNLSEKVWLAWGSGPELDTEQRLSNLCFWALHYEQLGCAYGLDIPGVRIEPATGPEHQHQVLTALALFERNRRG